MSDDELELDLPNDEGTDLELDRSADASERRTSRAQTPSERTLDPDEESPSSDDASLEVDREAASGADGDAGRHRASHHPGAALLHHVITVLCVGLVLALAVYTMLPTPSDSSKAEGDATPRSTLRTPLRRHVAASRHRRIRTALAVYHLVEKSYPVELDLLVDRGLLTSPDLSYPHTGREVEYQRRGNTFELKTPPFHP